MHVYNCIAHMILRLACCTSQKFDLGPSMSAALVQFTLIAITSVALIAPITSAECNKNLQQAERGALWEDDVVVDDHLKLMYGCGDNDDEFSLRQDGSKGAHRSKDERSSVQVVEAKPQV